MARNLITTNHGLPISTLQSQQTGRSHSPVDLEFKYKDVTVELTAATFAFNHHSAYHHSLQLPNHHQQTVHSQDSTPPSPTFNMTAFKASTCCRQGESAECACAQQATCSCGQKPALHCTCDKASTENSIQAGARCSCRARPAGECTCQRAATENVRPAGATCACGVRPADACTCEKAADGDFNPANEVDFTTRK